MSLLGAAGGAGALSPEEQLLNQAVVVLSCASYRNQSLNVFLRPALLALALQAASSNQKRESCAAARMNGSVPEDTDLQPVICCVFFRGSLQQLQLLEKRLLQRVHPLSWSYCGGRATVTNCCITMHT